MYNVLLLHWLSSPCMLSYTTFVQMHSYPCSYFGSSFATVREKWKLQTIPYILCMNVYGNTEYGMFSYTKNTNWNKCWLWRMLYDQNFIWCKKSHPHNALRVNANTKLKGRAYTHKTTMEIYVSVYFDCLFTNPKI